MKTDYKIGDRVIFKNFGIEEKGTIIEDEDDYYPTDIRYRIKFDNPKDNLMYVAIMRHTNLRHATISSYYHVRNIRLDVQYYRELRLNKLLDNNEKGL